MVAIAVLASPGRTLAQRGGGGGGRGLIGTGTGVSTGSPSGVSEKDDLKNFHRVLALQANDEQRAAFAKVAQYTQAACDRLTAFRESLSSFLSSSSSSSLSLDLERSLSASPSPRKETEASPLADGAGALDQAIAKARAANQNFLTSFSAAQKSGLKDITNRLEKAESEVDKQIKALDQLVQTPKPERAQLGNASMSLEKELAGFQSEQLALGSEMGILLSAGGQDLTFNLPKVTNAVRVGGETISVAISEVAARTATENGRDTFSLKLVADLSDLQVNLTSILREALTRTPRCGERIEVQKAALTPQEPASLVLAQLHVERWVCPPGQGSMEVAGGDATFEVKLTPSVETDSDKSSSSKSGTDNSGKSDGGLRLTPKIVRVEAEGFLRDLLRSGDLGVALSEQIAAVLQLALTNGADLKAALPTAGKGSAVLQGAQFQDAGAEQVNLVLNGRLEMSDEQTQQFAAQLKQPLAAQGTPKP